MPEAPGHEAAISNPKLALTRLVGSDDATGEYFMHYFDEREVSRTYDVDVRPDGLT